MRFKCKHLCKAWGASEQLGTAHSTPLSSFACPDALLCIENFRLSYAVSAGHRTQSRCQQKRKLGAGLSQRTRSEHVASLQQASQLEPNRCASLLLSPSAVETTQDSCGAVTGTAVEWMLDKQDSRGMDTGESFYWTRDSRGKDTGTAMDRFLCRRDSCEVDTETAVE